MAADCTNQRRRRGKISSTDMKKAYWIVLGVALLGLFSGTFADVQISQAFSSPDSPFGHFFATAAMAPIFVLFPIAAGLLFGALLVQFGELRVVGRILSAALEGFGVFVTFVTIKGFSGSRHLHGLPFESLVILVICAFLLAAALGAYASRGYPRQVLAAALIGVVAVCGSRYLLDALKNIWGRQRFWTMDNIQAQFTAWYLPQFPSPERMADMGDKIKSFPSGHSLGTISVLWLSLFPSFLGVCQKRKAIWTNGITAFALCFWLLTVVSRVILGEHFLSDVSVSGLVFLVIFLALTAVSDRLCAWIYGKKALAMKEDIHESYTIGR